MTDKSLAGKKIVILTANGCDEAAMSFVQRAMMKAGVKPVVVSVENGLITSWNGRGWGLNFPVDAHVSTVLAADMDMLLVLPGERSNAKLLTNMHTERIIKGFMDGEKPVAAIGDGIELLASLNLLEGRTVCAPEKSISKMVEIGAKQAEGDMFADANLLSGKADDIAVLIDAAIVHFTNDNQDVKMAA